MTALELAGCRPEPLLSYLKALGIFRLVSEQQDPRARAQWTGETFVLHCSLDHDALMAFLVDEYEPTPIVTPWNGGGGFDPARERPSEQVVTRFDAHQDIRLGSMRRTITAAREVYELASKNGWSRTKDKGHWIAACRARFPDAAVEWLDASVVLIKEADVAHPPLLGSGGNFGRFDVANNFLQRLEEVLCLGSGTNAPTRTDSLAWAEAALFEAGDPPLLKAKIGQYDPGRAGENKSSPLGERGDSIINPWDYVLGLEGTLLFASAAARRLGAHNTRAAMPFMVRASAAGYPDGSEAESREADEVWAPLWGRPATLAEVRRLIGEGRAVWGDAPARTALDFGRAAATLGVDRGIDAFVRYAIVPRFGQNPLAVPVGRVRVQSRSDVPLLRQIDPWVDRIRSASPQDRPATVNAGLHRLDASQFAVVEREGPRSLQGVLAALADLESAVAVTSSFRDRRAPEPVTKLPADEWVPRLNDGSAEFGVAAALASAHDQLPAGRTLSPTECSGSGMALLLRSVCLDSESRRLKWTARPPRVAGLATRRTIEALALVHRERVLDVMHAAARGVDSKGSATGVQTAFERRSFVALEDAAAFARGEFDDTRLGSLLCGLLLLDWTRLPDIHRRTPSEQQPVDPALALLAPFFHGRPIQLPADGHYPQPQHEDYKGFMLKPESTWLAQLMAGRVAAVASRALLRLRMARLDPAVRDAQAVGTGADGQRLAAVLLTPLSSAGIRSLLDQVVPKPILPRPATKTLERSPS